jgi:hypothetical protein
MPAALNRNLLNTVPELCVRIRLFYSIVSLNRLRFFHILYYIYFEYREKIDSLQDE